MLTLLAYMLTAAALVLCVPVAVLTVEVVAAVILKERTEPETDLEGPRPRIAVLIPAHDEGAGVLPTISDVQAQLRPGDRLLVVADNCTDNTAKIARSAGAEVTERHEPEKVGKGYALDWGLRHLQADPPDIVIIVDADCRLAEHCLNQLALSCQTTGRPAQALYFMKGPVEGESLPGQRVAHFAWIVKTYVRPMGLTKLGLPCQLMGTGMAFALEAIRSVELASGHLVEDLKLGLDLAAVGMAPRLCSQTYVESAFPVSESATLTQRRRWELGSLGTIANVPSFIWTALTTLNLPLLTLALDALVPPLVLLAAGLVMFLLFATFAALAGVAVAPLLIVVSTFALLTADIVLAWAVYGRTVMRAGDVRHLIIFFLKKLRIYRTHPGRRSQWIRTDRQ